MELNLSLPSGDMTPAELKILDYINPNTDAFLFLSIGQLAQRLDISESTISRFARHAGCKDFKSLKSLVMEQFSSGPAAKLATTIESGGSLTLSGYLEYVASQILSTASQSQEQEFQRAAEAIVSAGRVYIHGKNASASLAQLLAFRLRRLGLQAHLLPSGGSELLEGLFNAGEGDVLVSFSFSKLSKEGRIILSHGRESGCKTVSFVSRTCLPPDERADISLYVYRGQEREYHSMAAPAAVLDALVVAVTQALGDRGIESLSRLRKLKDKYFS